MGSPALYDALVQEQERAVIERTHRGGAVVHVHCHGNVRSTIEKVIARGGDFFEPVEPPPNGDITFAEAKRIVDGRITLGGNIEARIIEHGTPAEIDSALAAAYEGGTERMILKPSAGPIGAITPVMEQNLYRIIEFWERSS
jgi:uroporphyrinogen-III decarboxylase